MLNSKRKEARWLHLSAQQQSHRGNRINGQNLKNGLKKKRLSRGICIGKHNKEQESDERTGYGKEERKGKERN